MNNTQIDFGGTFSRDKLVWRLIEAAFIMLIVLSTLGLAVAQECDNYELSAIATPRPAQTSSALKRTAEALAGEPRNADVVLIGDSILQVWPTAFLESLFPGATVANYGVVSDRIGNVRYRLADVGRAQASPKTVVLWVGTNDMGEKVCALTNGLAWVILDIRRLWPTAKLVVMGIAPRGALQQFRIEGIAQINATLRAWQLGMGYRFVDTNAALRCFWGEPAPTVRALRIESTDDLICRNFKQDEIHLTDLGYAAVSAAVADVLDQ